MVDYYFLFFGSSTRSQLQLGQSPGVILSPYAVTTLPAVRIGKDTVLSSFW
jgi:hypothetical protein